MVYAKLSDSLTSAKKIRIVMDLIKNKDVFEKDISQLENENIRTTLQVLMEIQQDTIINSFESSFKELEDTSLGKLAKEIMSDINVHELQKPC